MTTEDIVSGKRYQQRVLDIVVESVAVSNAFEREAGCRWYDLQEMRLRRPEPAAHIGTKKLFQGICRQFR
jgi:hypothetical protein